MEAAELAGHRLGGDWLDVYWKSGGIETWEVCGAMRCMGMLGNEAMHDHDKEAEQNKSHSDTSAVHIDEGAVDMRNIFSLSGTMSERWRAETVEYFTAGIRNGYTRKAYWSALGQFAAWCRGRGLTLERVEAVDIAGYVELCQRGKARASVKQHLAAIRMFYDWMVCRGLRSYNPGLSVKGPRHVVTRGKTPVLSGEEMRLLLESVNGEGLVDRRDAALLKVMAYSFARVGAVVSMKVGDYGRQGGRIWLRLAEKNGKVHDIPAHREVVEALERWIQVAGIGNEPQSPLFRSLPQGEMSSNGLTANDALRMVKRRAERLGLDRSICCHSFRATGITQYLKAGGSLEQAQALAAHSSPRTTKLYDRSADGWWAEEVDRIQYK